MKRQTRNKGYTFWNSEYKKGGHLTLSDTPSEDLIKFTRWLLRQYGFEYLNKLSTALDLGCGNGRNIHYIVETYNFPGIGFDTSREAIEQAKSLQRDLPLTYKVHSIADPLPVPDESQTIVLDMMTSHFLNKAERESLLKEIVRVLRPGGFLFWKTFLQDEDAHAKRLLRDHPAEEAGSYIHPTLNLVEHVFTEAEILEALKKDFIIHKITKSHRHRERNGGKRRSISVYAQKN